MTLANSSWVFDWGGAWMWGAAAWVAWAFVSRRLVDNSRGEVAMGLVHGFGRLYARAWHNLRVEGRENIPGMRQPGPLIVVANHTAGVDPILVQAVCPFEIRWMMAKDMMEPSLAELWEWADVIPVDRSGKDTSSAREAISHLRRGQVIGVFPEGRLERPARTLMPFLPGVGLIVRRTGARVLPVVIEGTPQVDPVWASVFYLSDSVVRFMEPIEYGAGMAPAEIVEDLRGRYERWTGWVKTDAPDLERAMRE
jgi:1-acyl-sn-glycerol-3-phosphate acyltransferase